MTPLVRRLQPRRRPLGLTLALGLSFGLSLGHSFTVGLAQAAPSAAQADWHKIKSPPLRPFTPEEPQRVVLDNGMVVFLLPNHELPLISLRVIVPGGTRDETADKAGLATLFGQTWRSGGTKKLGADQLDDFLAARDALVETSAGSDQTTLSANFLKTDFDAVFPVIVDLLREPELRQDKLDLAKRQLASAIARRNDNPLGIAQREAARLAYGPDHPLARQPEYATVAAVSREDLLAWHRKRVEPQHLLLGITGDFEPGEMLAKLRALASTWPKGTAAPRPKFEFKPPRPGIYFVEKGDVNQSSIQLVQLGTLRSSPDYYALQVMNEVLGGGFSARLFSNVRSKKGLAYSVGGGVGAGWDVPALYRLAMGTASPNTVKGIQALREEIEGMLKNPPSAAEVERAKEALLNSFVFNFDTKGKILADRMSLEFYGYPADFTAKMPERIAQVTVEEVRRVAEKYLNPQGFAVLVVGKSSDFGTKLDTLGAVMPLDITIPPPPAPPAPAIPAPTVPPRPITTSIPGRR